MNLDGAKTVTPTRHTCAHCKQTNLKSANLCNGCGQLFHKACLLKNHKYVNESGEQIECIGHEIPDNTSVASSVSSVTRKKRKRYDDEIDVSDIVDKVDILIDRVEELGVNVADYRSEIRNIATEIFLDFKDDVVKEVRGAVKEEVREVVKEEVRKVVKEELRKQLNKNIVRKNSKKTFAIVSLNINGLIRHKDVFEKWLFTVKPEVICITETHIDADVMDHEISFENYNHVCTYTTNNRTGGVITYINKNLKFKVLLNSTEISHKTWINIVQIGERNGLVLINVYRSPNSRVSQFKENMINLLENYVDKRYLIIVGDFNLDVGCDKDRYAKKFVNECALLGLNQSIKVPTRSTLTSDTIIDLVFSNFDVNTEVLPTPRVSDHNIILINTNIEIKPNNIYDLCKTNVDIEDIDELEILLDKFNDSVISALDVVVPKTEKTYVTKLKDKKWITKDLLQKIKERDRLFFVSKNSGLEVDINNYKKLRNNIVDEIRKLKRAHNDNYIDVNKNDGKTLWRQIKELIGNKKAQTSIDSIESDGKIVTNNLTVSNEFNHYFVDSIRKIVKDIGYVPEDIVIENSNNLKWDEFDELNEDEV
ncbi:Protein of unknown function, partial [Cotesia congregata]